MAATHSFDHPTYVEGCYLCRLRSVAVSPSCTPSRSGASRYQQTVKLEKSWSEDIPAYKRLVKGGVQPDTVDGAAQLEKQVDARDGQVANVE